MPLTDGGSIVLVYFKPTPLSDAERRARTDVLTKEVVAPAI
jgi:hypothetical protein